MVGFEIELLLGRLVEVEFRARVLLRRTDRGLGRLFCVQVGRRLAVE